MTSAQPDFYAHPMFEYEGITLDTPAIRKLHATIQGWLWSGATGGFIAGDSRVGKTFAMKNVLTRIYTRSGQRVPGFIVPMMESAGPQATNKSVKEQIAYQLGLYTGARKSNSLLRGDLVNSFLDIAAAHGTNCILLFADDIQCLKPCELTGFAHIFDALSLKKVFLMTVFMANEQESSDLLKTLEDKHYTHIRGRFFKHLEAFMGLTAKQDVEKCLAQYDSLRFPDDGPTYVAHFLPHAAKDGWRLADQAGLFWSVFRQYQKQYAITSWPMDYFVASTHLLLIDQLPRYGVDQLNEEMLHECIRRSGILPSLVKPIKSKSR